MVYYTLEIFYKSENEVKIYRLKNIEPKQLKDFREYIYTAGLYVPIVPDQGEIISPFDIQRVFVYKQNKFHEL